MNPAMRYSAIHSTRNTAEPIRSTSASVAMFEGLENRTMMSASPAAMNAAHPMSNVPASAITMSLVNKAVIAPGTISRLIPIIHFPVTPPIVSLDAIAAKYQALGGAGSFLGAPIGAEVATGISGGYYQNYQGGTIYWSPATGAHPVQGSALTQYQSLRGPGGILGYPTTDAETIPGGVVTYFQNGKIITHANGQSTALLMTNSMSFQSPRFTIGGTSDLTGTISLTVNANGSYIFTWNIHDTGGPHEFNIALALVSPSGTVYTFAHYGSMAGGNTGNLDDIGTTRGSNSTLAANWADLLGGTLYIEGSSTQSATQVTNNLVHYVSNAIGAVPVVVPVLAAAVRID